MSGSTPQPQHPTIDPVTYQRLILDRIVDGMWTGDVDENGEPILSEEDGKLIEASMLVGEAMRDFQSVERRDVHACDHVGWGGCRCHAG